MKEFKANSGSRLSDGKANQYGHEILHLMRSLKTNKITSQNVVDDAKRQNSAYHDYFEWDDTISGNEYRKIQAKKLLSSIVEVVIIKEKSVEVRSFYNIVDEKNKHHYAPKDYVFSDEDLRGQVIDYALREVNAWSNRYRIYGELASVHSEIDRVTKKMKKSNLSGVRHG